MTSDTILLQRPLSVEESILDLTECLLEGLFSVIIPSSVALAGARSPPFRGAFPAFRTGLRDRRLWVRGIGATITLENRNY